MAQFERGKSGNPGGRPRGRPNKVTLEVRDLAKKLVENPEYRRRLESRLLKGTLPPPMESMIWHYAFGKPKDFIEHSGSLTNNTVHDFSKLSEAEFRAKVEDTRAKLDRILADESRMGGGERRG